MYIHTVICWNDLHIWTHIVKPAVLLEQAIWAIVHHTCKIGKPTSTLEKNVLSCCGIFLHSMCPKKTRNHAFVSWIKHVFFLPGTTVSCRWKVFQPTRYLRDISEKGHVFILFSKSWGIRFPINFRHQKNLWLVGIFFWLSKSFPNIFRVCLGFQELSLQSFPDDIGINCLTHHGFFWSPGFKIFLASCWILFLFCSNFTRGSWRAK